jgi:hypothetical protein
MKREPALRPLSRDHHQALVVAQRLGRADEANAGEQQRAFVDFWHEHGLRHFQIEEEVLLPAYSGFGDVTEPAVVRVLTDHVEIRRMAHELEQDGNPSVASLRELGKRLGDHVRHEERVLFPLIEAALPADRLSSLAAAVEAAEAG